MSTNTVPEETEPMLDNHATTIKQTMYDTQIDAGYFTFCGCKTGATENLISKSIYSILCDMDETGTHVVGLEILSFPQEGFRRGALDADLALSPLSTKQKAAITAKLIR